MNKKYILISLFTSLTLLSAEKDDCPNCREKIALLKEKHAMEIELYEKNIGVLMVTKESLQKQVFEMNNSTLEKKDRTFNQHVYIPSK